MIPECGDPIIHNGVPDTIAGVYPAFFILDSGRVMWR